MVKTSEIIKWQDTIFSWVGIISWILYILLLVGVVEYSDSKYFDFIHISVQLYISIFLIWRFNPWSKASFNYFDKKVAFSAGLFLFTTSIISSLVKQHFINK